MNRYLIAALYVMAGCAVTIPLKAQNGGETLRGERCRLVITNAVKIVSVYLEEEEQCQHENEILQDAASLLFANISSEDYFCGKTFFLHTGALCRIIPSIRAPEKE